MDLTLFIVLIIIAFMLYHMTSALQSLIKEMKEVKNKCMNNMNLHKEDFKITTENPTDTMKKTIKRLMSY